MFSLQSFLHVVIEVLALAVILLGVPMLVYYIRAGAPQYRAWLIAGKVQLALVAFYTFERGGAVRAFNELRPIESTLGIAGGLLCCVVGLGFLLLETIKRHRLLTSTHGREIEQP